MPAPLRVWLETEGRLSRLRFSRPKANLLDDPMIDALDRALADHLDNPGLSAILLDAEGRHFSDGASVEEHFPWRCEAMLADLHSFVLGMDEVPVTIFVAVRGPARGGGLEVALAGHLLFTAPGAVLGQPEMKLGVFAPAASCLLLEELMKTHAAIEGLDAFVAKRAVQWQHH